MLCDGDEQKDPIESFSSNVREYEHNSIFM